MTSLNPETPPGLQPIDSGSPEGAEALELHARISSVFDNRIYPPKYEASFRRELLPTDIAYLRRDLPFRLSEVTTHRFAPGDLNIRVGYDPVDDTLAVNGVVLPLQETADSPITGLFFKRVLATGKFVIAHEYDDGQHQVLFSAKALPEAALYELLAKTGFDVEKLPENYVDLRLKLTQLADEADIHTVFETVPVSLNDPSRALQVVRATNLIKLAIEPESNRGDLIPVGENEIIEDVVPPSLQAEIKTFQTILGARISAYDEENGSLRQIQSVMYSGLGANIYAPVVIVDHNPKAENYSGITSRREFRLPASYDILRVINLAIADYLAEASDS